MRVINLRQAIMRVVRKRSVLNGFLQISHSLRQIALLLRENAEFEVGAAEARIQVSDLQLRCCDRQLAIA
jgi:hypothetical protein